MGAAGISHQVCYACTYESDPRALTVVWSPVEGVGNGVIQGRWELSAAGSGTLINFENTGLLKIPIPRLLKSAGVPFVKAAFARQIETYIENLCRTFSDGVS